MGIKKFLLAAICVIFSVAAHAQQEYTPHTVQAGETVYAIAKQYNVTEADLLKYNPDIAGGLRIGTILLIPVAAKNAGYETHNVIAKETIYSICKMYGCTEAQLMALNPELKDGLKAGMVLKIPKPKTATNTQPVTQKEDSTNYIYHTVEAKETVYSICRVAGITEAEFLGLNPKVRDIGLQEGMVVRWPKAGKKVVTEDVATDQKPTPQKKKYGTYRIVQGDTRESIAAQFGMTVEELIKLNPELATEVPVDRYIVVHEVIAKATSIAGISRTAFWYSPSIEMPKLRFAVVLPFFLQDTDSTGNNDVKKSEMAVQFYTGFKLAMDTLAKLGFDITLDVYDSENSVNTTAEVKNKIASNVDAVIGPLYSKNAEFLAEKMPNTLIVSPMSKALNNGSVPNLMNCVPDLQSEFLAIANQIIGYGPKCNVIFVNIDTTHNQEAVKFITQKINLPESNVKTVWVKKSNYGAAKDLNTYMVPGAMNVFVVIDQSTAFVTHMLNKARSYKEDNFVLLGTSKIWDIQTIESKYLNRTNFIGFAPDFVDYTDTLTQKFILAFRAETSTDPSKFGFYGYDTGLYFAQVLAARKSGLIGPEWPIVKGIYKGFNFYQKPGSGAINNYVYKVRIKEMQISLYE